MERSAYVEKVLGIQGLNRQSEKEAAGNLEQLAILSLDCSSLPECHSIFLHIHMCFHD